MNPIKLLFFPTTALEDSSVTQSQRESFQPIAYHQFSNLMRMVHGDIFGGIIPPTELFHNQRYSNLVKLPISGGIVPLMLSSEIFNTLKKLGFPTNGERTVPASFEQLRSKAITRHITPYHPQK